MSDAIVPETGIKQNDAYNNAIIVVATGAVLLFFYAWIQVPEPSIWPHQGLPIWLIKATRLFCGVVAIALFLAGTLDALRAIALEVVEKLKA